MMRPSEEFIEEMREIRSRMLSQLPVSEDERLNDRELHFLHLLDIENFRVPTVEDLPVIVVMQELSHKVNCYIQVKGYGENAFKGEGINQYEAFQKAKRSIHHEIFESEQRLSKLQQSIGIAQEAFENDQRMFFTSHTLPQKKIGREQRIEINNFLLERVRKGNFDFTPWGLEKENDQ